MRLRIDRQSAQGARLITQADYDDRRRYYLLPATTGDADALIVCRNGLELNALADCTVDASIGWDTAQAGFCIEEDIGKRRTKITVYRVLRDAGRAQTLRSVLGR